MSAAGTGPRHVTVGPDQHRLVPGQHADAVLPAVRLRADEHRPALDAVAVQQVRRCPARDGRGELPAKVHRFLQTEVEPLPAARVNRISRPATRLTAAAT